MGKSTRKNISCLFEDKVCINNKCFHGIHRRKQNTLKYKRGNPVLQADHFQFLSPELFFLSFQLIKHLFHIIERYYTTPLTKLAPSGYFCFETLVRIDKLQFLL